MGMCTADEIKARIYTGTLEDSDITALISEISEEILDRANTTDTGNKNLIQACKFATCAAVLRKMKTTGEMAARVKNGNAEQQNSIDQDIRDYEDKASYYLRKYLYASKRLIFGRSGPKTVNNRL